jgi:hypothetical protein
MLEERLARLRAHRNNIRRYKWLLTTQLSDVERGFITKRLEEEAGAALSLSQSPVPETAAA